LHRDCACSERASKVVRYFYVLHRPVSGVATGWTGVDMSTPLLLEVTPEIDTNPTSFTGGGVGRGRGVAPPPDLRHRFALRARHVCPAHIF